MNKILKRILFAIVIFMSILTIANVIYTFPSFKFSVISKIVLFSFTIFLLIVFINFLLNSFSNKFWKALTTIAIVFAYCFGLFSLNSLLLSYNGAMVNMGITPKYKTVLIASKSSSYNSISDINSNTKIGIQTIGSSYENGSLALNEIKKLNKTDNISQFSSIKKAYTALKQNKVDIITVSSLDNLNEIENNSASNYKVVGEFTSSAENTVSTKDITTTPFTILISGIDSRSSAINDIGNGDSNIIVTFNPKTGRVTTLTTPRDSYVKLACTGSFDKLTHSAAYGGTDCVKKTLEDLYDVEIDYTVRINFVGVIDVVNALGGIDVDVPVNSINKLNGVTEVCEQNSHGQKNTICWEEGKVNKMNGETALAFARNRYKQDGGDFYRGRNQQIVIEAILKKATQINNIGTINNLLSVISKHMKTNLTKNDILSLYDVMLGLNNGINIEKLYISGSTGMVGNASVVYPNEEDLKYAQYRMKVALDLAKAQFPKNDFYIEAVKPSNEDGNNPLQKQKMPFDGTIEQEKTTK